MPTANTFDVSPALLDSNQQVNLNGAVAELQPEADEFGSTIYQWTEVDDAFAGGIGGGTVSEAGGEMTITFPNAAGPHRCGARRDYTYGDCDIVCKYITNAAHTALLMVIEHWIFKNATNAVRIAYEACNTVGSHRILCDQYIGGVFNNLSVTGDLGLIDPLWLRIKRLTTSGPSNNYFYMYSSTDGNVWTQRLAAQIRSGGVFDENDLLWPLPGGYTVNPDGAHNPDIDRHYQYPTDIGYQRYYNTSPIIYIIDNALVEHAFDASAGKMWQLTGAACTKNEPGTSTVKFKVGYSDTGVLADATWVDVAWKTIAQVSANAAAGLYDGHRYLHLQAQFYSDSADKPTLTDFTINGAAVSALSHSARHHNMMRRIKYGMSRIRSS